MRDYIRREMAAEFDAMITRDKWLETPLGRAGLEKRDKSGWRRGQEMMAEMQVIRL